LKKKKDYIKIEFDDGTVKNFSSIWLRDNCKCRICYNHDTYQRVVETIPLFTKELKLSSFFFNEDKSNVAFEWTDGHETMFSVKALIEDKQKIEECADEDFKPIPWKKLTSWPKFHMNNIDQVKLFSALKKYGIVEIQGCDVNATATKKCIEANLGYIRETIFGGLWDFTADLEMADTAYTTLELKPHTDGCYMIDPPGLQIFHMLYFDGTGGKTVLVDGFSVGQILKQYDEEAFNFFVENKIPYEYVDEKKGIFMQYEQNVFGLNSKTQEIERVAFNNSDRMELKGKEWTFEKIQKFYKSLKSLLLLLHDPSNQIHLQMQHGSLLVIDNQRLLHGRTAFTGYRRICGSYIDKDLFECKVRNLIRERNLKS